MHEHLSIYEYILKSNIINFTIMISVLVLIFKKTNMGSMFDKMAHDIKEKVETSAQAAQRALEEYRQTKREASKLPDIKEGIINKAQITAQEIKEKTHETILKDEKDMDNKLESTLVSYAQKAQDSTTNEIYNAIMELSKEEVLKLLDEETQNHLVQKAIQEIDAIGEIRL